MLTREQIEEIQGDAREKGISIKALLKEKGIPEHSTSGGSGSTPRKKFRRGSCP